MIKVGDRVEVVNNLGDARAIDYLTNDTDDNFSIGNTGIVTKVNEDWETSEEELFPYEVSIDQDGGRVYGFFDRELKMA